MGYDSWAQGGYSIDADIPESKWPDKWKPMGDPEGWFELRHVAGNQTLEVVNGKITVVGREGGLHADFRFDDAIRQAEEIAGEALELVTWAKGFGANVNGVVSVQGEESGDFSRIRITNNVVFDERPKLVWPTGEIEEL